MKYTMGAVAAAAVLTAASLLVTRFYMSAVTITVDLACNPKLIRNLKIQNPTRADISARMDLLQSSPRCAKALLRDQQATHEMADLLPPSTPAFVSDSPDPRSTNPPGLTPAGARSGAADS